MKAKILISIVVLWLALVACGGGGGGGGFFVGDGMKIIVTTSSGYYYCQSIDDENRVAYNCQYPNGGGTGPLEVHLGDDDSYEVLK